MHGERHDPPPPDFDDGLVDTGVGRGEATNGQIMLILRSTQDHITQMQQTLAQVVLPQLGELRQAEAERAGRSKVLVLIAGLSAGFITMAAGAFGGWVLSIDRRATTTDERQVALSADHASHVARGGPDGHPDVARSAALEQRQHASEARVRDLEDRLDTMDTKLDQLLERTARWAP